MLIQTSTSKHTSTRACHVFPACHGDTNEIQSMMFCLMLGGGGAFLRLPLTGFPGEGKPYRSTVDVPGISYTASELYFL